MKIRAQERGFAFPYLYDGDTQAVTKKYGPVATPHVFVFDEARKLRFVGRIDDAENPAKTKVHDTRNAIDALLTGQPVPVSPDQGLRLLDQVGGEAGLGRGG